MEHVSIPYDEQETDYLVVPSQVADYVEVFSCVPSDVRYYLRLAAEHPDEVKITHEDKYGLDLRIPASWFRRPKPPRQRNLTDEQKAATAARLAAARAKQQGR